jgi:type IX secretion system PorP/SprF family membrane protein
MKKILHTIILLVSVSTFKAQQLPIYSQFYFNDYVINPAATGLGEVSVIQLGFRNQWTGFTGAPRTFSVGGYARLAKKRMGIGGMLFRDDTGGALSQTGALINYSYHLKIDADNMLAMGLSGAINQYAFDGSQISNIQNDAALQTSAKQITPDLNFGIMYQWDKKLRVGISANQLLEARLLALDSYNQLNIPMNRLARHFCGTVSYKADINRKLQFEPYALIRSTFINPAQFELGTRVINNKSFMAGLSYRHQDAAIIMIGAYLKDLYFTYNYDLTLSDIKRSSSGSHELMVGYRFRSSSMKQGRIPMAR